ncbi:MAG: KUP/HAK/KT family potassium transporter [Culicoidibacterales bacterium]
MDKKVGKEVVTLSSMLVALGIVYGDIGTSPLYVMRSILEANHGVVTQALIFGAVSLVFWTLTLQTTLKYVIFTLRADNHGEGGIFSLYTLVRKRAKWLIVPAVIGGAALLADGMITPAVTVTSAIEGLELVVALNRVEMIAIVLAILAGLFIFQQFGTKAIGKIFGPVMFIWFGMLAVLGGIHLMDHWPIIAALNPYYGLKLLLTNPQSVYLLGAVFLCTTGAEALYSDLGHCGRRNIHYTWFFVKVCLVLNYLGQGAWLMQYVGQEVSVNPFFGLMPSWFLVGGIVVATFAAIIASQALISGSFTLVSEAIKLNVFPRLSVRYPNDIKGQIYVPTINYALWLGCSLLVLYFQESAKMEAAYGLAITVTMLMTTILLYQFLRLRGQKVWQAGPLLILFGGIELGFLYANLFKFFNGGYITILVAGLILVLMLIWIRGGAVKNRYQAYVPFANYRQQFQSLQTDEDLKRYATHVVYMSESQQDSDVETKIMYSIFNKRPKKADFYWFVHIRVTDEPYTKAYHVVTIVPNQIYRVEFILGFRVQQRVNIFLRQVIRDLQASGEFFWQPKAYMLTDREQHALGDFRFVLLQEVLSNESGLSYWDERIFLWRAMMKRITVSPAKWFGIDTSNVEVETVPIRIGEYQAVELEQISEKS